ncbi:ATPase of the AAA+ class, CDC48 family [Halanaeroarchaeum sp. HSR-CO]|uniref:AAA family ATPase n=1 Tax=Halanaeroarchaeum sp. HSR-CO TaxID=2866382 RepID=UPI00217D564B|nr:AAA family ATPase [Halanaeroarchaeum sp. HSR-CO]UWG49075.1 ATPase of the AAA+ class, CDC48 family [Halanaeroarchaeum sp. HSR-CO]
MSTDADTLDLVVTTDPQPARADEAGIERAVMRRLGVAPGEYVAVEGRDRTVASVSRASVDTDGVALGPAVRENAAVDPGDRVTVAKTTLEPASQVTVAPTRAVDVQEGEVPLGRALAGRPVSSGDAVDATLLDGTLSLPFVVTDTIPDEPVLLTEQTTVLVRDEPVREGGSASITVDDVGGLDDAIGTLRESITSPLTEPGRFERLGERRVGGVLLTGPAGSGKTLLAQAVATEMDVHVVWLDSADVAGMRSPAVGEACSKVVREARANAPTLVVVDELDEIAPADDRSTDRSQRIAAHLRSLVDALAAESGVALLGIARKPGDVDPSLRRGGRLERDVSLGVPSSEERREILDVRTRDVTLGDDVDLDEIAARTHGFVGADLSALVSEAVLAAARREDADAVSIRDFERALAVAEPSAMRDHHVDVPTVTYEDVGGLEEAKRALVRSVEWPMRFPDLFEYMDATPPRGILLYGPPGTGKTMLAKAVAHATEANFISVKGPEVLDKWVGESERAIRDIFETARQHAPSVVFFDEVDAISPRRGEDVGTQVVERVVSQLLTEMDGLEPLDDVVVIGATNRPDVIDPALVRTGRFEQLVEVGLPDRAARRDIFTVHTASVPMEGVNLDALAAETAGYTGSDIEAVVREASLLAIEAAVEGRRGGDPRVTAEDFARGLAAVTPSAPHGGEGGD